METEPSVLMMSPSSAPLVGAMMQNERQVVRRAGRQAIRQFLEQHNCFSVLRASGKVVVFDTRIPIQLAFYALVEHDMLAAPLWEPHQCQFVGLLTVTDFIDVLRHYQATQQDVSLLATHSIGEILGLPDPSSSSSTSATGNGGNANSAFPRREFRGADSSCSLKQACQQLLQTGADFLPVVFAEDMRVLSCLTYTNVLEHLVTHFREQRRLFDDSIADLGIGTYGDALVSTRHDETLSEALAKMHRHSLSALPVLDANGKICGVYSRSDITFLTKATDAEDAVRNLDLPVSEVLLQQRVDVTTPDALRTCTPAHTLQAIFESFAQLRFNRLYVVDHEERVLGVVSAKDLVRYFLSEEEGDENDAAME